MTGSRRILSWIGAGMIIVAGAPAAQAAAAAGPQPRDLLSCGGVPADFDGGYRDVQYPEVGLLFQVSLEGKVTVYYRGNPIGQGSAEASNGVLTWTQDDSGDVITYTSTSITCSDPLLPTRVTGVVATPSDGSDQITLYRA